MTDLTCTCRRPLSAARKVRDGVGVCACGRRWVRLTLREWRMASEIDDWNRAMRTATSRRKFAITGRV